MNEVTMQANIETLEQEQKRRRENAKEQREKETQRKKNTARNIYIGELVSRYFPEVARFHLQRTKEANAVEFKPLARFLEILAADTEYITGIKEKATHELSDAQAK